jgi:hypothetical protein
MYRDNQVTLVMIAHDHLPCCCLLLKLWETSMHAHVLCHEKNWQATADTLALGQLYCSPLRQKSE